MRRIFGTIACLCALAITLAWIEAAPQQSKAKNTKASKTAAVSYGNSDVITQDELMVYDYFLASDQLEGRNTPSRGYDTAALYVASHLKEWGLKPGGSTTGTNGPLQPYFIPIELVTSQLDAAGMKLSLTMPAPAARGGRGGAGGGRGGGAPAAPAGPRSYEYAKGWTVGAGGGGFGGGFGGGGGRGGGGAEPADIAGAPMVFVGNGYVINKSNTNPYQGINVRGKIMVVAGMPIELVQAQQAAAAAAAAARGAAAGAAGAGGRGGRGGAAANPLGVENTDFMTPQGYAVKNGALGIIMIPTFQQLSAMANPPAARGVGPNGPAYQVLKFQAARQATVPTITAGIELTNDLLQNEKLTATQVFEGAAANTKLDSFDLNAEKKLTLHIAATTDHNHTEDVIGILEGSDPVLKNEYVVISGHLDHLGLSAPDANGDTVFNGADDDGSGSTAVLAVARAFAEGAAKGMRSKRTMIFLWVTGEEKGLWGSQYFNEFPPIDITKVVGDLNMDMIGRTKTPGYVDPPQYKLVDPNEIFVVGPNISSDDLEKMLETVNSGYQKMAINHFYDTTAPDATHDNIGPQPNGQRIFYRSDHYNFAKNGIPIAFFTTGLHPDYHRLTDSPEKLDYKEMQAVSKTVAALGWVLANTATPPKLNAKLPDQLIQDMKAAQAQGWGKLTAVLPPLPGMPF
jgi:Zn-dependent M28 family amino/carboxypeptidase